MTLIFWLNNQFASPSKQTFSVKRTIYKTFANVANGKIG